MSATSQIDERVAQVTFGDGQTVSLEDIWDHFSELVPSIAGVAADNHRSNIELSGVARFGESYDYIEIEMIDHTCRLVDSVRLDKPTLEAAARARPIESGRTLYRALSAAIDEIFLDC